MHVYGVSRTAQWLKMGQVQMGQSGRQCERVGYRWGGGAVGCSLGKIGIQWLSVGKRWMQIVPLGCIVDKSGVQ